MARLRVLTWHVHGSYLEALAMTGLEWYVPFEPDERAGYARLPATLAGHPDVHQVAAGEVPRLQLDAVLFQSHANYLEDQYRLLSHEQRRLPRIHLEHDPPRGHPTDTRHPVDDPDVLLVHCTAFNELMWDAGRTPTRVIDHGVATDPSIRYDGRLERGIVVINDLATRGRRLGADLVQRARDEDVPLDVVGLRSEHVGGLGPIPHEDIPRFIAPYRFFFHSARYTSLGLAVIEAMLVGLPIVALATTEMPTVLEDGRSGIVATDPQQLINGMRRLLRDPALARRLGSAGQDVARERFGIERFARDWRAAVADVVGRAPGRRAATSAPVGASSAS